MNVRLTPTFLHLALSLSLVACGPAQDAKPTTPAASTEKKADASATATAATTPTTTGNDLGSWKVINEMKEHGEVSMKDGVLTLGIGKPMTGVVWGGKPEALPVKDYEVAFEAQRVEGSDFFAALSFPVRDIKTCVTLVLGGWGGSCVGISNIQYQSANENESTTWFEFKPKTWYKIRLQVRANSLIGFIDDEQVFAADTTDRHLGMRFGEIDLCTPFGFASYGAKGQIKNLKVSSLPTKS